MASDRAKWSNYIHSHKLGSQSVNTTPFCAGTQVLVTEHQVWTAPFKTTSQRAMSTTLVEAPTVTFQRFFFLNNNESIFSTKTYLHTWACHHNTQPLL